MSNKKIEEVEIDMSKPAPKSRQTNYEKFWHNKQGDLVIFQMPNKLIIFWFISFILWQLIHLSPYKEILGWVSFVLIIAWSLLEAKHGVNYFRKSLGLLVFLLTLLLKF